MRLVFAAAVTELLELQTASGRLFVLRSRVIPLLALSALQRNNFPHFQTLPEIRDQKSVCSCFIKLPRHVGRFLFPVPCSLLLHNL
jgi:hypothetical protein